MNGLIVVFALIAVLFIYIYQARRSLAAADHNDPDRFFLSTHSHSKQEFGSAQVAYFLQMATVYPFFIFGFSKQWWLGAWNTFFWAVGIVVFIIVLPRCNRGILDLVGRSSTPHALISGAHNAPFLRTFASTLSITAFIGLALFEMIWGTVGLKALLGGNNYLYYITIAIFALYLITVLLAGGQRGAIITAQYQLLFAYIGLHLLTAWALAKHGQLSAVDAPIIFPVIFIIGSIAVLNRLWMLREKAPWMLKVLNIGALLSLASCLFVIVKSPDFLNTSIYPWKPIELPKHYLLMLIAMGCLPIFFQFVDMTNWQRLSSLSGDKEKVMKDARSGLKFFLLESPLSWLFPLAIGMSAVSFLSPQGVDPWESFMNYATGIAGPFGAFLAVATVVGMICVFLSTADSLLSATGYAFAYDIYPKTRDLMDKVHTAKDGNVVSTDERALVVNVGKYVTAIAIFSAATVYIVVDAISPKLSEKFLWLAIAFYAPMLSFAPSMLVPILTGRAASASVSALSMAVAAALGIFCGFYSLVSVDEIWMWLGIPLCFVTSWAIYLLGFAFSARPIQGSNTPTASSPRE